MAAEESCTWPARSGCLDFASSAGCCRARRKMTDSARRRRTPRPRRQRRKLSLFDPFRLHVPVRICAEIAILPHEHLPGFLVPFERPQEPVGGDVGKLAAARMKYRRGMAGVVP